MFVSYHRKSHILDQPMTKELIKTEASDHVIQPNNEQFSILEQLKKQQEELLQKQRELFLQDQLAHHQQQQQQQMQLQQQNQLQPANNWTFTQGLVLGQISVIFIIIVFVKFLYLLILQLYQQKNLVLMQVE